jgi:hypothetical protein
LSYVPFDVHNLFTLLKGVNITKRNMVSETMANMFIAMGSDVHNPCYCTSEPAEHGFGKTWRSQHKFTDQTLPLMLRRIIAA